MKKPFFYKKHNLSSYLQNQKIKKGGEKKEEKQRGSNICRLKPGL